jgi:hypothetical protein
MNTDEHGVPLLALERRPEAPEAGVAGPRVARLECVVVLLSLCFAFSVFFCVFLWLVSV